MGSNKLINRIGEENINKFGERFKIIFYNKYNDMKVEFCDGTVVKCRYDHFKDGQVYNPNTPSVYGRGFIGVGDYTSGKNNIKTIQYKYWYSMLQRCFDTKLKNRFQTYADVCVCDEWLNFQNFAKWFDENYYNIEGETMCLDKDLLKKGNKLYSQDTCVFLPQDLNTLIIKCDKNRGKYPLGVSKHYNTYEAKLSYKGNRIYIGQFKTPEDAFAAYKSVKESKIKEIANEYRCLIPEKAYNALINYKVEIND